MEGQLMLAFERASAFFVQAVESVDDAQWGASGLGAWTLLELVAHANRAHITIEDYLLRPQLPEPAGSGYFSEEAVAERGRRAVAAIAGEPKAAISAASARSIALVAATAPDAVLGSPAGTMPLAVYLPSRIAELTVHGLDIVRSSGTGLAAPADAVAESLQFIARRATQRGDGERVLLALSGRQQLPAGFSVY
jgi:uncharacterized protein (TIGR03083 family)